jgi:DNA-binding response OmpR family regulator
LLKTILLVDDDPDLRDVLVPILTEPGYSLLTASDGYEALRILVEHSVDLLITDIKMPGISGFALARQAKVMRPNLHVIYLTGVDSESDRFGGPTYGQLLRKPVRASELLNEISREFASSGAR